jgi:hypothetical protein
MDSLMSGMDMDSASDPLFRVFNQQLASGYWYIIAGLVGFILLLRAVEYYQTWSRSVLFLHHAMGNSKVIQYGRNLTRVLIDYGYVEQERQLHTQRGCTTCPCRSMRLPLRSVVK